MGSPCITKDGWQLEVHTVPSYSSSRTSGRLNLLRGEAGKRLIFFSSKNIFSVHFKDNLKEFIFERKPRTYVSPNVTRFGGDAGPGLGVLHRGRAPALPGAPGVEHLHAVQADPRVEAGPEVARATALGETRGGYFLSTRVAIRMSRE